MYLLYCDESGTTKDPNQIHYLFSGICTFERQSYWIANEMDKIASTLNPADPHSIEFHGSHILGGKGSWRKVPYSFRNSLIKEILDVFIKSHVSNRIFICVVNKAKISPSDAVEFTFEQLASRFDKYLLRLHRAGDTQRGIIIFDKSTYENTIQNLAIDFRTLGHTWGILRNLSEVPLFIDSKASRLIQMADIIAYSAFQYYEHGDDQFYKIIKSRIDTENGIVHGLYENI